MSELTDSHAPNRADETTTNPLPEPSPQPAHDIIPTPPSPAAKRRASSPPSNSHKRPRLSPPATRPTASRPPTTDDKSRTRRLFGSLLTTLAQPQAAPRRRRDIGTRPADEKRGKGERGEAERGERWRNWEAESMRARHRNLRAQARFLRTVAEPRVFYKPYILSKDQREVIARQVEEAEERIGEELRGCEGVRRGREGERGGNADGVGDGANDAHVGANGGTDPALPPPTDIPVEEGEKPEEQRQSSETLVDEHEVVVEGDEDTVIY